MRITPWAVVVLIAGLTLNGCERNRVFSPAVLDGVDTNFDFAAWRVTPNAKSGQKVQLGGRILQVDTKDGNLNIVLTQLPIVDHPAYGPTETARRTGEFLVSFRGKIPPNHLQAGNRVIVVGTTQNATVVGIEDALRTLPSLAAQCLHIWNTGGREISDFPSFGAGYQPLEEDTYCAESK